MNTKKYNSENSTCCSPALDKSCLRKLTKDEIHQALCERHSPEVQAKLDNAHVAIAGLGGLGSNVAFSLARIGVGHLHLIDFDRVDITNLNRQQYFMRHIGMYKTDALTQELMEINPYLRIRTDCLKVDESNISGLFDEEDIICEAFDNPEAKAMLVNSVLEHFPEKKLISASGMAGYRDSNTIRTRQPGKNFYLCGDGVSEPSYGNGLMAPRVAVCAGHEANIITQLIINS
jgi:sulfur carrier protein ThiS adenylyltransferase